MADTSVFGYVDKRDDTVTYLDFNTLIGVNEKPELIADLNAINNSLFNLFTCVVGSRPFNREYGTLIPTYIHNPCNEHTADLIRVELFYQIPRWEPRIIARQVEVKPVPQFNEFHCVVLYEVKLRRIITKFDFTLVR
jgi:phage baseplate assembly protein W